MATISMTNPVSNKYSYTRLASQNSTAVQIFTGYGTLHFITVNLATAATVGLCDGNLNTNPGIPTIGKLKASVAEGTYRYDAVVSNGLRVIPSGHLGDLTVVWSK